jgi:hypothetical protein
MLQFRPRRSQEFYAPGRDILGYYRPLNLEVLALVKEAHPGKEEEVEKLEMLMNAVINEATAGPRGWDLPTIIAMADKTLDDIDEAVRNTYCRLFMAAITFRYVLGKREVPEHQVKPEELGGAFSSTFVMGVVPEELEKKLRKHLLAYGHIPRIVVDNEPPCEIVEVEESDGKDDQSSKPE